MPSGSLPPIFSPKLCYLGKNFFLAVTPFQSQSVWHSFHTEEAMLFKKDLL